VRCERFGERRNRFAICLVIDDVMILPGANLAGAQAQAARLDTGLAAGSLFVGLLGQEAAASWR
jgi:hypothetical protein